MAKKEGSDKKMAETPEQEVLLREEAEPKAAPEIYRFSVNLGADSAEILRATAARRGFSVTDAFRRAIAIMDGIDKELVAGHLVESVDPSTGSRSKLIFL